MQGDVPANESYAASAVALGEEGADQVTTGWALSHLSAGAFFLGDTARAITLLDRALPLLLLGERSIDRAWAAYSLAWRGLAAAMGGDVQRAITGYEEALRQARESGSDGIMLFILDDFAGLLLEVGQLDQAHALAGEAMEIATLVNETWLVAHAVLTRASIDAAAGNGVHAAQGLGAAEAFYRAVGLTMPPPLQRRRDLAEDRARQALGIEAFEAETSYGRTNPLAVVTATLRRERAQLLVPAP
jgi:tetratricopeptide (TPR) repeat protein